MTGIIGQTSDAEIVCGVDAGRNGAHRSYPVHRSFAAVSEQIDVVIDFSHPAGLGQLTGFCAGRRVPLVTGTTGFTPDDRLLLSRVAETVPVLSSPNMSFGVSVVKMLARIVAAALGEEFDAEIIERHHSQKADAPSGTALAIADAIRAGRGEQLENQYGRGPRSPRRGPHEIGIHSLRGGTIVGEHSIVFAGPGETIEISHSALSRDLFGQGALRAARFIVGRAPGLYGMDDVVTAGGLSLAPGGQPQTA